MLDIQEIEKFLLRKMSPQEKLVFETNMLASPGLKTSVEEQCTAMRFIRLAARDRQRERLSGIYDQLAQDPSFAKTIHSIFN